MQLSFVLHRVTCASIQYLSPILHPVTLCINPISVTHLTPSHFVHQSNICHPSYTQSLCASIQYLSPILHPVTLCINPISVTHLTPSHFLSPFNIFALCFPLLHFLSTIQVEVPVSLFSLNVAKTDILYLCLHPVTSLVHSTSLLSVFPCCIFFQQFRLKFQFLFSPCMSQKRTYSIYE